MGMEGILSSLVSQAAALVPLPSSATLLRKVSTDDGMGGSDQEYVATGAPMPCYVWARGEGRDSVEAQRLVTIGDFGCSILLSSVPTGGIQPPDRLRIDGNTYDVIQAASGLSFQTHLHLGMNRVQQPDGNDTGR